MIGILLVLTLNQLTRQRRTLLLVLLAGLPVLLAVLFRIYGDTATESQDFARVILGVLIVNLVLPLTALVVGTAAIGQELDDGTVVYLLAKPVPRWKVVVAKMAAAWMVTGAVALTSVLASGLIILVGHDGAGLLPAFALSAMAGALAYSAVFVSLSIRFGRALIIGLAYVFVWEALISQFIPGVRFLSIRAYTFGIADPLTRVELPSSGLGTVPAVALMVSLTLLATWYAIRRLGAYELSERV